MRLVVRLMLPVVLLVVGPSFARQDHQPIETVDQLLDALEAADKDIERLSTPVALIKDFALAGDQEVRMGRLAYRRVVQAEQAEHGAENEVAPKNLNQSLKQFNIRFEQTITGQTIDENVREYIFDGEWLVEKFVNDRQFIKRQMVAPGEHWDPLRLGEGPFPVPIGQRRADILREFVAKLATDPATGLEHPRLIEQAASTYQLVLEPRPELMDSAEFETVRLWYDHDTLLPRMIRAINFAGDKTTVVFRDVRVNEGAMIAEGAFDTTPPPVGSGWDVSVEPWRSPAPMTGTTEGSERIESTIRVEGGP